MIKLALRGAFEG